MAGHAEHVAETQQDGKAKQMHGRPRPRPKPNAGGEYERGAEPRRSRVVAAIDPAPDLQGREDRDDGESSGDGKAELNRPVRGRDPDDEDQRLHQRDVGEEWDEQPVIDVALRGAARARLLSHGRIGCRGGGSGLQPACAAFFSGVARVSKACGLRFSVSAQWGSFSTLPAPKQFWKLMYEALTREDRTRVAANWSRPGQFFSLFLNSTCAVWGSFLGAGITRFRPSWKVAGVTPLSPWEGAARTP